MQRREFLKAISTFCMLSASFTISGCLPYKSVTSEFENGRLKVKKSEFEGNWVVVKAMQTNTPLFLSKTADEKYEALLMECTHKQCEVKPEGNVLTCPCHGAEFSFSGKVMKGPAEENLKKFETITDENFIYIILK